MAPLLYTTVCTILILDPYRECWANTVSFFFTDTPDQTLECDMRLNSAANWYSGTEAPLPIS